MLVVGAAIIDRGALLAARRIAPPELAGLYEFPGGKVDQDEAPVDALVREVREELGVGITCHEPAIGSWLLPSGATLLIYRATLVGHRPERSSDHDDLVWLPRGKWRDGVPWIGIDREAVALLEDQAHREEGGEGQE
jgi:8-oxo-dGTP diphosphatase